MFFKERKRLLLFGLPWTFVVYTVTDELLTVCSGLLRREEFDCYLYTISDIHLHRSFLELIFGLGTIRLKKDGEEIRICHIRNAKTIKDFLVSQSEAEKFRRGRMVFMP